MDRRVNVLLSDNADPANVLRKHPATFDEIIEQCSDYYNLAPDRLTNKVDRDAATVRYMIIYLAGRVCRPRVTQREISRRLNIHHTNISAAINKTLGRLESDELLRDDLDVLMHRLAQTVLNRPCR